MQPGLEFDLRTEQKPGCLGTALRLVARQGETWLGECVMERGHASPVPDADDWCYCNGLSVANAFRGQRLGLFLLSRGLQEMHRGGCRHASISTSTDNYRAALLYANLGYRVVDSNAAWRKELDG